LRQEIAAVIGVYRFGSTVQGTPSTSRDIEAAVLAEARLTPKHRFEIQEALAAKLGRDVDLVDLAAASTVMAMQVSPVESSCMSPMPVQGGRFEDYTFGAYARLDEERRGILDRVAAEGTVYGRAP
jgi:predicted nucleotidyltransferase